MQVRMQVRMQAWEQAWAWIALVLAALIVAPEPARASGDGGCGAQWTLEARERACSSRIVIGPGNDTRVNMLLLLRDRADLPVSGTVPDDDWRWLYDDYGKTFLDWDMLAEMLYPYPAGRQGYDTDPPEFGGTRCQTVEAGGEQLLAAAARNRLINAADRTRLTQARAALVALCRAAAGRDYGKTPGDLAALATPRSFASLEAREYGTYIAGAAAFYAGDWRGAKARFAALRNARDEWVRDTARYMEARTALGQAAAAGSDEWGYFDAGSVDRALARGGEEALAAYVLAYPSGRYAASARGLMRRARWMQGESARQADAYNSALAGVDPRSRVAVELISEIDNMFLFTAGARQAALDPLLLATLDLLRMRATSAEYPDIVPPALGAEELDAQQATFAAQPELFAFVQANHAFYITADYARVLELLPDDARRTSYSPLQFSAQALRGMALARLGDRNEVGFWRELLGGSAADYQRPTAELGLALALEKAGQVDQVFAPDSPIADTRIRQILLEHAAGPDVLRAVAFGTGNSQEERNLAGFVLLYRRLRHGEYAAALEDMPLMAATGPVTHYDPETYVPRLPTGVFANGAFTDNYPCPSLRETTARLAQRPRDVAGRLCLGEFFRLNGFDQSQLDYSPPTGTLGAQADYPGDPTPRSRYYSDIIAERGASREDRAYALYRAIRCYAPAGYSSCGGEEVAEEQRAAWFRRLKNEFGDTRWGRDAEFYW